MAKERLPFKPGLQAAPHSFPKERARVHELRLSAATTLSDLTNQYAFYSPAMIYMFIRLMGREPLWDFVEEYGKEVVPVSLKFNKPLFEGLTVDGDRTWNYVLYGMEHEDFNEFRKWMGTLTFMDRDKGLVHRIRYQDIQIVDPLFLDRTVVLPLDIPTVPVTVFALDSNKGCCWLQCGDPVMDLPTLRYTGEVFKDTQEFSDALLLENENPYGAVSSKNKTPEELEQETWEKYKRAKENRYES